MLAIRKKYKQNWSWVEFFNNLASFPKGPVALALKTQLPIVPTTFLKINNKYTLVLKNLFTYLYLIMKQSVYNKV